MRVCVCVRCLKVESVIHIYIYICICLFICYIIIYNYVHIFLACPRPRIIAQKSLSTVQKSPLQHGKSRPVRMTKQTRMGFVCSWTSQGSPNRHDKAPEYQTKPQKDFTKLEISDKRQNILDKDSKYLTRVATNMNLAYIFKYPILNTTY